MPTMDDHARAGIAAMEERDLPRAIAEFEAALKLAPDRPDLNNLLGMCHLARGDAASAVDVLKRAVALADPEEREDVQPMKRSFHLNLGQALMAADRTQDALDVLRAAATRWPASPEPRILLGVGLLGIGSVDEGLKVYDGLADLADAGDEVRESAQALAACVRDFIAAEHDADLFLRAHQESYVEYFNAVADGKESEGWYVEAARMARGPDGEPRPIIAEGAASYALSRVDLVNPSTGEVASIYSEREPMVVALNGLEALAQAPILFQWRSATVPTWVSTRTPWHWLPITIRFAKGGDEVVGLVDELIGPWYLDGFNGRFGEAEAGRFHYVSDLDRVGEGAVSFTVDLGRARFEAIEDLMRRIDVLHARHPIERVLLGQGRLP